MKLTLTIVLILLATSVMANPKRTISNQELRDALNAGATIALVKVADAKTEAPRTRGHQTRYSVQIEDAITGKLTGTVEVGHYGSSRLRKGQTYIVAILPSNNFGQELLSFMTVPTQRKSYIVKLFRARIAELNSETLPNGKASGC